MASHNDCRKSGVLIACTVRDLSIGPTGSPEQAHHPGF